MRDTHKQFQSFKTSVFAVGVALMLSSIATSMLIGLFFFILPFLEVLPLFRRGKVIMVIVYILFCLSAWIYAFIRIYLMVYESDWLTASRKKKEISGKENGD
jgi:hypothetical protein